MGSSMFDTSWIWHPDWNDSPSPTTAGGFVDFRREFNLKTVPEGPVLVRISADTRYRLYINSFFVHTGPVKGDAQQWYFDELDIQPFLQQGENNIAVRVLRFFYGSHHGISFVRMPVAGLYIAVPPRCEDVSVGTNENWETSIDDSIRLPCDLKDDDFLHVYEEIDRSKGHDRRWVPAEPHRFMASYGIGSPWKLSPRAIPYHRLERIGVKALHNVKSTVPLEKWTALLLESKEQVAPFTLSSGSKHHVEIEVPYHITAYLKFKFTRPKAGGSVLRVQYSECYEDEPLQTPYARRKADRTDTMKGLFGPHDLFVLGGPKWTELRNDPDETQNEIFSTFHFRTFRVLSIDIEIARESELTFQGMEMTTTNYALDARATFEAESGGKSIEWVRDLWTTSLRTLVNCMHDTYEDCPFYEQLQYAMDARSSILFTYNVSGDDRLARQAITQLYHSFQPKIGITASRAPAHQLQIIPNFSLYWVCMVFDHYQYFEDEAFLRNYLSGIDAVLDAFDRRINKDIGLIASDTSGQFWEFVDWIPSWKPFGVPPAAERSGYLSFTNALYAYTLKHAAGFLVQIGKARLSEEYQYRADSIVQAIQEHCFDGKFFTDGLARDAHPSEDYSPHSQIWAILCGAIDGEQAAGILNVSLSKSVNEKGPFDQPSIAMSFYTLRALSKLGPSYDRMFTQFWQPWRDQIAQNVTTWCEDDVSMRSDCHAWGSAPLFEFVTEVAGIYPAEPGFRSISFKPRSNLFPNVKATVPINGIMGSSLLHVEWNAQDSGQTSITFRIEASPELTGFTNIKTHVVLTDGKSHNCTGIGPHVFSVYTAR